MFKCRPMVFNGVLKKNYKCLESQDSKHNILYLICLLCKYLIMLLVYSNVERNLNEMALPDPENMRVYFKKTLIFLEKYEWIYNFQITQYFVKKAWLSIPAQVLLLFLTHFLSPAQEVVRGILSSTSLASMSRFRTISRNPSAGLFSYCTRTHPLGE